MSNKNEIRLSWPNLEFCKQTPYGSQICTGLIRFYRFFFKDGLDSMDNFDLLMLHTLLISFIGFFVAVFASIIESNETVTKALGIIILYLRKMCSRIKQLMLQSVAKSFQNYQNISAIIYRRCTRARN